MGESTLGLAVVSHIAIGARSGLILFATMSLLSWYRAPPEDAMIEVYRSRFWFLMAMSTLLYSPAHTAWLVGHPIPKIATRTLDCAACILASVAMIHLLAARGLMRGISAARVKRGMVANLLVLCAIIVATWAIR